MPHILFGVSLLRSLGSRDTAPGVFERQAAQIMSSSPFAAILLQLPFCSSPFAPRELPSSLPRLGMAARSCRRVSGR